jgi:hypothetical protein
LNDVNGVKDVRVDWRGGRVWVLYDPARIQPAMLVDAINKHSSFKAYLLK